MLGPSSEHSVRRNPGAIGQFQHTPGIGTVPSELYFDRHRFENYCPGDLFAHPLAGLGQPLAAEGELAAKQTTCDSPRSLRILVLLLHRQTVSGLEHPVRHQPTIRNRKVADIFGALEKFRPQPANPLIEIAPHGQATELTQENTSHEGIQAVLEIRLRHIVVNDLVIGPQPDVDASDHHSAVGTAQPAQEITHLLRRVGEQLDQHPDMVAHASNQQ